VICNPKIKFAAIIKLADKLGIEYVATGHYARIFPLPLTPSPASGRGCPDKIGAGEGYKLFEAKDKNKDQSYFLYGLNQKQLARIIFPLGNYKKPEVKEMARKMGLPVFDREESHDVCFVSGKLEEYLKKNLKLKRGKIVNQEGKILGEHQGLPLYTIGQRKGINLGGPGPYYVIEKNIPKNELVITDKEKDLNLFQKLMTVEKVNWISEIPEFPLKADIRIRYGHPAVRGIIRAHSKEHITHNKILEVSFEKPQRAITPGQSAVFYAKNGEVLGGGIIM
jgi:tRNA-specific 2-thiouridylase